MGGVTGVAGEDVSMDELSVLSKSLRKLLSNVEKSEFCELVEELDDRVSLLKLEISGAVKAWTFVVEINSVGSEIKSRRMLPAAYRTVLLRAGRSGSSRFAMRFVKARARDMIELDECDDLLVRGPEENVWMRPGGASSQIDATRVGACVLAVCTPCKENWSKLNVLFLGFGLSGSTMRVVCRLGSGWNGK